MTKVLNENMIKEAIVRYCIGERGMKINADSIKLEGAYDSSGVFSIYATVEEASGKLKT